MKHDPLFRHKATNILEGSQSVFNFNEFLSM